VCAFAVLSGLSDARAIDCNRAATQIERLICADPNLVALDDEMSYLYSRMRNKSTGSKVAEHLLITQREFLWDRDRCPSVNCLYKVYGDRVAYLRSQF
jgi:uncharacterized protein